jgi:hypothetical protein
MNQAIHYGDEGIQVAFGPPLRLCQPIKRGYDQL